MKVAERVIGTERFEVTGIDEVEAWDEGEGRSVVAPGVASEAPARRWRTAVLSHVGCAHEDEAEGVSDGGGASPPRRRARVNRFIHSSPKTRLAASWLCTAQRSLIPSTVDGPPRARGSM